MQFLNPGAEIHCSGEDKETVPNQQSVSKESSKIFIKWLSSMKAQKYGSSPRKGRLRRL